jgi:hypothetical protein
MASGAGNASATPAASSSTPLPPGSPNAPTSALDELFTAYLDAWLLQAFDRLLADMQSSPS